MRTNHHHCFFLKHTLQINAFLLQSLFFLLVFASLQPCGLIAQATLWEKAKKLSELYDQFQGNTAVGTEGEGSKAAVADNFFSILKELYPANEKIDDKFIFNDLRKYKYLEVPISAIYQAQYNRNDEQEKKIEGLKHEIETKYRAATAKYSEIYSLIQKNKGLDNALKSDENGKNLASPPKPFNKVAEITDKIDHLNNFLKNVTRKASVTTPDTIENNADILSFNEKIDTFLFGSFKRYVVANKLVKSPERFITIKDADKLSNKEKDGFSRFKFFYEIQEFQKISGSDTCAFQNEILLGIQNGTIKLEHIEDSLKLNPIEAARQELNNTPCSKEILDKMVYNALNQTPININNDENASVGSLERKISGNLNSILGQLKEFAEEISRKESELLKESKTDQLIIDVTTAEAIGLVSNNQISHQELSSPTIVFKQQTGGSLESSIIDGTAKWIASRMREELNIAFFDRFEKWLESKNIQTLFPNTSASIGSSLTTDYELMIKIFKSAFEKDLNQLPFNLAPFISKELNFDSRIAKIDREISALSFKQDTNEDALKRKEKEKGELQKYYRIMNFVVFTINAINLLNEGEHPTSLLTLLNQNSQKLFPNSDKLSVAISVLDALSQSLVDVNNSSESQDNVWKKGLVLSNDLKQDPNMANFFFGLIQHEVERDYLIDSLLVKGEFDRRKEILKSEFELEVQQKFEVNIIPKLSEVLWASYYLLLTDYLNLSVEEVKQKSIEISKEEGLTIEESSIFNTIFDSLWISAKNDQNIQIWVEKAFSGPEEDYFDEEAIKLFDPAIEKIIQDNKSQGVIGDLSYEVDEYFFEVIYNIENYFLDYDDTTALKLLEDYKKNVFEEFENDDYYSFKINAQDEEIVKAINAGFEQAVNLYQDTFLNPIESDSTQGISNEMAMDSLIDFFILTINDQFIPQFRK